MLSALYNLLVMPIQILVEITYSIMRDFLGNKGLSIIAVSLVIQTLVLPLYKRSDALEAEERDKQKEMSQWVNHIRKTFKGDERFMMLSTYYRQQNYKTYYSLKSSFSILLQVPFFLAAYNYLSNLAELNGTSFLFIKDLGKPDAMFVIGSFAINVLPIMMTLLNIISGIIYTKGMPLKSKIQVYGLAAIFLVLLYKSPSGLVLYWTMNNMYSMLKNVFMKILKHPLEVLDGAIVVACGGLFYYLISRGRLTTLKLFILVAFALCCQIPLLLKWYNKKHPNTSLKWKERLDKLEIKKNTYIFEVVFLTILIGILIPISVISASSTEFIVDGSNPMSLVYRTFFIFSGFFLVWFSVFYMLMTKNARKIFEILLFMACGATMLDYMVFGRGLGLISPMLVYDKVPVYSKGKMILNLVAILILVAVFAFIMIKKSVIGKSLVQIGSICMIVLCVMSNNTISKQMDAYRESQKSMPRTRLSH